MKSLIIFVLIGTAVSAPQKEGYSGIYASYFNANAVNTKYSGQYLHDNSGVYKNDVEQYNPDGSGAYKPDNQGGYQNTQVQYKKPNNLIINAGISRAPVNYDRVNSYISGQYIQDNSGAYNNDNGQYRPDGSGAYKPETNIYTGSLTYNTVNKDFSGQYIHDNSGAYKNDDGQYHPDGSGAYKPDNQGGYQNTQVIYKNPSNLNINAGLPAVPVRSVNTVTSGKYREVVRDPNLGSYNGGYAIIRQIQDNLQDGYHYIYETENQINGEEEGHLEKVGQDDEGINVRGRYSYTGPDNVVYSVEYTADAENGFVPVGAHLPTASVKKVV